VKGWGRPDRFLGSNLGTAVSPGVRRALGLRLSGLPSGESWFAEACLESGRGDETAADRTEILRIRPFGFDSVLVVMVRPEGRGVREGKIRVYNEATRGDVVPQHPLGIRLNQSPIRP
jgi:hypothetical protein